MRQSLAYLLAFLVLAAVPASAGDCPEQGPEGRQNAIAQAPSCMEAVRIFKLCAIGATLDGVLALRVQEKCEKRVLSTLPATRRKDYEAGIQACNAQYFRKKGSIYRSRTVFCHVDVIEKYAGRH
jgi:hypothetical protein